MTPYESYIRKIAGVSAQEMAASIAAVKNLKPQSKMPRMNEPRWATRARNYLNNPPQPTTPVQVSQPTVVPVVKPTTPQVRVDSPVPPLPNHSTRSMWNASRRQRVPNIGRGSGWGYAAAVGAGAAGAAGVATLANM